MEPESNQIKFYVVGTPIGNLEDITFRAVAVLQSVDLVLCEDTRVTMKLFSRYGISTPLLSYHSRSKLSKIDHILELMANGKTLALVSDAGTPGISDPGSLLVSKIWARFPEAEVLAVPGPSAVISALSVSGLPSSEFLFLGFLPHKKGRKTLIEEIVQSERTCVFYESPHRIMKALSALAETEPSRRIAVSRELTKMFESLVSGTALEVLEYFKDHPDKERGEFVVTVAGKKFTP